MALYDSPTFRMGSEFATTMLNMARVKQMQQQLDRQDALAAQTLQDKQRAEALDAAGRQDALNLMLGASQLDLSPGQPDPTGHAPRIDPGYGDANLVQDTRLVGLNPTTTAKLLDALSRSPGTAKVYLDPQAQPFLQQAGFVQSPKAIELAAMQRADAAEQPARAAALRSMGRTPEDATAQAGISPKDYGLYAQADMRSDLADTKKAYQSLLEAIQGGNTPLSAARIGLLDARTGAQNAKTDATEGLTDPARVRMGLDTARTQQLLGQTPPEQALTNERNARAQRSQHGTPSAKMTQGDKDVEAFAARLRNFTDIPGGWFSRGRTAQEQARAYVTTQSTMAPGQAGKWERAYQQVYGGQGTAPTVSPVAPAHQAQPGEEVRQDPRTGKRYVRRNGQVMEVQ